MVGRLASRLPAAAIAAALLTAALLLPAAAAATSGDSLGSENVGTAGAQFLRIPVGARAVGLGQSYVACADDGSAGYWNPAGLMRTPGRRNLFFSHTEYTADISIDYAAYQWHRQNFGFAITAGYLDSGDILRTTEMYQEGTGQTFNANQYLLGFSLARSMTDRFSVGGTVKFFQENLDEFESRGLLMDLGVLYYAGVGDLRIGFAVRNFGSDLRPGGTPPGIEGVDTVPDQFQSYSPPTSGSFGAAYTWSLGRGVDLMTTLDFHHPSDFSESFRMGGELSVGERLLLRGGYETDRDEGGAAGGFGVKLKRDGLQVRLDYGYSDMGAFGDIHHLSVDLVPQLQSRRSR